MLRFRVQRIVPPGGRYLFRVPETGVDFEEPTFSGLLTKLKGHYDLNKLTMPENIRALVEHYICQRVPAGFCVGEGERTVRAVTLEMVRKNTQVLLPGGLVTLGEAKRRLDICGECEYCDRRMCSSCVGLNAWARKLVGRTIKRDDWLGVCAIDVTALPARIHMKVSPEGVKYPAHCWAHEEKSL